MHRIAACIFSLLASLLMAACATQAGTERQEAAVPTLAPGACLYAANTYAPGAFTCQGNYQNQCRDGRWVALSMPC